MRWSRMLLPAAALVTAAAVRAPGGEGQPAGGHPGGETILDTKSFWRFRTIWETPEIVLPSGEVRHAVVRPGRDAYPWFQKNPDKGQLPEDKYKIEDVPAVRLPADTPAEWMKPGFDDSAWARLRGPVLDRSTNESWKAVLMRGLFEVPDPEKAGTPTLSLASRGGAVVYLNGSEVGRAFMPKGDVGAYTPGEPYPDDAYFGTEGFALFRYPKSDEEKVRLERRVRRLEGMKLPREKLRRGVNVLAIAICRAPTLARVYASRPKGCGDFHQDCHWAKVGLLEAKLVASGGGVVPNTGALPGRGFKVWNQSIIQSVFLPDYPDSFAPLSPVRITGVRNGTFAGQVIVGDEKPVKGLKVRVSDLKGPGTIPAPAVTVRYGVPDGAAGQGQARFFDSLEDDPPGEVPIYKEHGGSLQPVWISVSIPPEAAAGEYSGTVTIEAEGVKPAAVELKLRVINWTLPPVSKFTSCMDLIQSPESVAMAYEVPLWSEEHFRLLDRTFSMLAPLAAKTLFITCVRRTHLGNEHAMVRWIRGEDEELHPDFAVVEKYLDTAIGRLGPVPGVILYCWEPPESQGHAGGAGTAGRTYDKPILYTLWDPRTGKAAPRVGPAWGTPESKAFWKKLSDGMREVLRKRGIEDSMLFGLIGDARPTKQAMDDISNAVPGAKWAVHSHYYCDRWHGYEIGMGIALWGIGVMPVDPKEGYSFGWSNPMWLSYYPREMKLQSTLVEHRVKLEKWMGAKRGYTAFVSKGFGPRGLGRIGADFWPVLKDERGRIRGSLAGRYPEAAWGQLNLNFCIPYVLGRGRKGAVPTVRSEAFRESLQEVEARIYIERALLDDEAKNILGEELMARCRAALDERIRMCLHSDGEGESWYISSGWRERSDLLFGLAAEVARKYGGKAPNPNLKPEEKKK
ncbi:MAG: DUF6067 family protein [Planctomycetota bacterium]|nr:DUF6067 family protein [Planctomycetota bacterium]